MIRIIVGAAKRRAHVMAAYTVFKEALANHQRGKELMYQLVTHPDATDQQILEAAASVRRTHDMLVKNRKTLLHAMFKEGVNYHIANKLKDTII